METVTAENDEQRIVQVPEVLKVEPAPPEPLGLFVNQNYFRLAPEHMWDKPCFSCGKPQARWGLLDIDDLKKKVDAQKDSRILTVDVAGQQDTEISTRWNIICAPCFLYLTPWGTRRADEIREATLEIEAGIVARKKEQALRKGNLTQEGVGFAFQRNEAGQLTDAREAGYVLGKIAVLSAAYANEADAIHARTMAKLRTGIILPEAGQFQMKGLVE